MDPETPAAATTTVAQPATRRRRWATWIALATLGVVSATAFVAVPAIAADADPAPDRVVVCESGVVDDGGIQTSSAVATRTPAGDPLPEGCREG
jgi:hypothetical protein